jgi:hypothetical protein
MREGALIDREEGIAEEIAALQEAPLDKRIEFLRGVPSAGKETVEELMADLRALQEGKGPLASPMGAEPAPVRSGRKGMLGGMATGLLLGALMGAGGAWYAVSERAPAPVAPAMTESYQPPSPSPSPSPPPPSRWASPEEEDLYLRFSKSNGGMALAAHCRGEGKVEVEVAGRRRNACLTWPPEE